MTTSKEEVESRFAAKFVLDCVGGSRIKCWHLGGRYVHKDILAFIEEEVSREKDRILKIIERAKEGEFTIGTTMDGDYEEVLWGKIIEEINNPKP